VERLLRQYPRLAADGGEATRPLHQSTAVTFLVKQPVKHLCSLYFRKCKVRHGTKEAMASGQIIALQIERRGFA